MHAYHYLIIGAGMAGGAAVDGIRSHDPVGAIGLIGAEPYPPYKRPLLSKGLWLGDPEEKLWRSTDMGGVDLHVGRRIVALDPQAGTARDDAGDEYAFERLILATGGTPRRLPGSVADVVYLRDLDDYRQVRALADRAARFAVVGGGFIGSETAAVLRAVGCQVTMVFPEPAIGSRLLPAALAAAVTADYEARGVEVWAGANVESSDRDGDDVVVALADGRTLRVDAVVAGLGIVPDTALAEQAGLPVDDGIVVDEYGRVPGFDGVFATGDVARFPEPALAGSRRVEHEDHANTHGRLVGANAAGANVRYDGLPFFYSDIFDFGYEAVGEVDSRLGAVEFWVEPNRTGIVASVDAAGRPRGFLLWGLFGKVDAARALIRAAEPVDEGTLRALAS